jgi:hypothetical protein
VGSLDLVPIHFSCLFVFFVAKEKWPGKSEATINWRAVGDLVMTLD